MIQQLSQPRSPNPFRPRERRSQLVFAPLAWLKLMFHLHAGDTEVGGFAITAEEDPLYVQDILTVCQQSTIITVKFDDIAVADHFDKCVDAGLKPDRFARIWWHTHPGSSPEPSVTDEETFDRVFGTCDWSIMFIVSRTGLTYARLAFNAGPGGELLLDTAVDWSAWPILTASHANPIDLQTWAAEYQQNVHPITAHPLADPQDVFTQFDFESEFERMNDPWLDGFMPGYSALEEVIG
jgi:hypothetical protein